MYFNLFKTQMTNSPGIVVFFLSDKTALLESNKLTGGDSKKWK